MVVEQAKITMSKVERLLSDREYAVYPGIRWRATCIENKKICARRK